MRNRLIFAFIVSVLFFYAYTKVSLELYGAHQTRGDLTAYAQGMWNTLHGNFMASTYNYSVHNYYDREFREITQDNSNIFGIHFNPILLLMLPLYALAPLPQTLLVLQAALVASGGLLIYLLAQKILKNDTLALVIQVAYLSYFATVSSVLSQFHAYTLTLFFGPLLLLATRAKSPIYYWLSLMLFLLVQENTSLVAAFFGGYLMLSLPTRRRGALTLLISITYFILTIYFVIPLLSPYRFYLFSGIYGSPLGGSIQEIIRNTLRDPILFVRSVLTPVNLVYLRNLLLAIIPFALLSPVMLLVAFSSLAQNILSSSLGLKTQQMHYESGSVAFLFYALILGMSFFLTATRIGKSRYGIYICLVMLLVTVGASYKRFTSPRLNPTLLTISLYSERDKEMDSLIRLIPDTASVSTQDYLSGHLASRVELYQFPIYADRVDYLLLSKGDATWPLTPEEHGNRLISLRSSHEIVDENSGFILLRRMNQ